MSQMYSQMIPAVPAKITRAATKSRMSAPMRRAVWAIFMVLSLPLHSCEQRQESFLDRGRDLPHRPHWFLSQDRHNQPLNPIPLRTLAPVPVALELQELRAILGRGQRALDVVF